MKKAIFLIAALLAVGTIGLAGCDRDNPGSGAGTDDLQPRAIIEDTDSEDTENGEDKNELKPPHCEERMPRIHRYGGNRLPDPRPMPRPERGQKIKR